MTDHISVNRDYWNGMAHDWIAAGERLWNSEPQWGIWPHLETELHLLPDDMTDMHAIELGCGTGYVSGWMARRGAQVTAIDISIEQLATARRLAAEHGADISFIEGNAEAVPRADASFDFAISEYGAAIWCDPDLWLTEAARLLKPGGKLAFFGNHPMTFIASPTTGAAYEPHFHRPYRDLKGADWRDVEIDPGGIEFNRTMAGWLSLFRKTGFEVVDYHELYAPQDAKGIRFACPAEWAKSWPGEQAWVLQKRAD